MQHEILYKPAYTLVEVKLEAGERIEAESGAMVYMSPGIEIATKTKGVVGLAPPYQGDITHHRLNGETLYIQNGSYMASSPQLSLDTKWGGAKSFFSREGLFLLKMSGTGDAFISSFGAIHEVKMKEETFIIDTGHMVAFTEGLDYSVKRVGGLKSTILSGEGLVAEFRGTGTLYLQTRSMNSFIGWLTPFLPKSG
ncbi:MAG: TIGR00266 family protein [Euryarchaeota archaeon]|nr:TIGR00266 family protein [Euryarchaeota archaeon]MBU4075186.1 TIGR00266 family protein [Euryarchaeota archaeon]MBU4140096.1 TIGR00266 family protein [Euryarchaeota archaeon]